mgnify:FL=1
MFFLRNESEKHKGGGGGRIIINKDSSARIDSATNIIIPKSGFNYYRLVTTIKINNIFFPFFFGIILLLQAII